MTLAPLFSNNVAQIK